MVRRARPHQHVQQGRLSHGALPPQPDIGYKTAWLLASRIHKLMTLDQWEVLKGINAADEGYLGGKKRKTNQTSKRDTIDDQLKGRGCARNAMVVVLVGQGAAPKRYVA